jgi:hypothetical protein
MRLAKGRDDRERRNTYEREKPLRAALKKGLRAGRLRH